MTTTISPYLFFDGNCREAMKFYEATFGGELNLMSFKDAPGKPCSLADQDKIMHAALIRGPLVIMASDDPEGKPVQGTNVQLSLNCASLSEFENCFRALSERGEVSVQPHDAFWGARFGMVTDRFGIHWMLSFDQKRK